MKKRLVNNESTQNLTRNGNRDEFFSLQLSVSQLTNPKNPSLLFPNVTNEIDACNLLSHSRSNTTNLNIVTFFLDSWYKYIQSWKSKNRVIILVPYKEQKSFCQENMLRRPRILVPTPKTSRIRLLLITSRAKRALLLFLTL